MNSNSKGEHPQITGCMYSSTSGSPVDIGCLDFDSASQQAAPNQFVWPPGLDQHQQPQQHQAREKIMADKTNRRIVQVFIADPNDNVPLDKSVLYTGEQKLTDLNDTELFFEVPIAELLKKHNAIRSTTLDKDASKKAGKDVVLDPARIRDLKMVVVTVAQF
jgi:hypothetical protein